MAARREELVKQIRDIHQELRHAYQKDNTKLSNIWQEHVKDTDSRKKYSEAMLELATECWPSTNNRITWCYSVIRDYFYLGMFQRTVEKFCRIHDLPQPSIQLTAEEKVFLLDVGSCYNPFRTFPDLDTLAIDLSPATGDVHQCDFLSVELKEEGKVEHAEDGRQILALPTAYFHAVVLCLVLEYLPAASQRKEMCSRAAEVLRPGGLLLIVTPDSNSSHRNAPMMRSWKQGLANLGLHRIKYLKQPHLHCMSFAKLGEQTFPNLQLEDDGFFYIPQDSNPLPPSPEHPRSECEDLVVQQMFDALPLFC